jgi:peptidyl-dipeptidase Dcp
MKVLTSKFDTKYDTAPFSKIKTKIFFRLFRKESPWQKPKLMVADKDKPTFENTIEALDFSGYALDRISSIFST